MAKYGLNLFTVWQNSDDLLIAWQNRDLPYFLISLFGFLLYNIKLEDVGRHHIIKGFSADGFEGVGDVAVGGRVGRGEDGWFLKRV